MKKNVRYRIRCYCWTLLTKSDENTLRIFCRQRWSSGGTTGVYPRLIRSAHRLAAIRVALAAGINLLGMALMAFIAIQLAMRGIVRIVRFQIGSLLSKRLIAIAVTR